MNKFAKRLAITIPPIKRRYEELENLRQQNEKLCMQVNALEEKGRQPTHLIKQLLPHVDFDRIKRYRSCDHLERFWLTFLGDLNGRCMTLCCRPTIPGVPSASLCDGGVESLENFREMRDSIINESKMLSLLAEHVADGIRDFTSACAKCPDFQMHDWDESDGLIHAINLSMSPAPCQCKCIYCWYPDDKRNLPNEPIASENYEKMFYLLEWAKNSGMIAADAFWYVCSGEIAIHPFKDRIFDLVGHSAAKFLTNCFVYNERIAENLCANPQSCINLSIDAGTPETWFKVKGFDNFNTVVSNLEKYFESSTVPGQISLKYIVLPGINDGIEDYLSVVEIMKRLRVKNLMISADFNTKNSPDFERAKNLLEAAGLLAAMLKKNGLGIDFERNAYPLDDRQKVTLLADELLKSGNLP